MPGPFSPPQYPFKPAAAAAPSSPPAAPSSSSNAQTTLPAAPPSTPFIFSAFSSIWRGLRAEATGFLKAAGAVEEQVEPGNKRTRREQGEGHGGSSKFDTSRSKSHNPQRETKRRKKEQSYSALGPGERSQPRASSARPNLT